MTNDEPISSPDAAIRSYAGRHWRFVIRHSSFVILLCAPLLHAANELQESPDPVLRQIEAAERRGDFDTGIALASEAIRKKATASHLLKRASLLARQTRRDEAFADLNRAVKLAPEFAGAWSQRGLFLAMHGQPAAAIADFDQALALDPKNARTYLDRGSTRLDLGQPDAAIADFGAVLRMNPNEIEAWTLRASAFLEKRDWDAAIADCTTALRMDPKLAVALNHRGGAYLGKQEWQKALADFDATLELEPRNCIALTYRAQLRRLKGDLFRALEDASEAIRTDSNSGAAYTERATIRAALGDVSAAVEDCSTALLVGGPNEQTLLLRALLYMQQADYRRARGDLEEVLATGSALAAPARVQLALLLAAAPDDTLRDPARASRLAREAVARTAAEPGALDALGAACAELGDFAGALDAVHKAIAATPPAQAKQLAARKDRASLYLRAQPYRLPATARPAE